MMEMADLTSRRSKAVFVMLAVYCMMDEIALPLVEFPT